MRANKTLSSLLIGLFLLQGATASAGANRVVQANVLKGNPTVSVSNNGGTLTLPTSTDTLTGRATTDTLTNKSISGSSNTVTNLTDSAISSSAAIARSKTASGTASHVLINDVSGVMSSEAQLAITRGGTGQATAAAGYDALSPNTTKGDIDVRSSTTNTRLPVGTDAFVLTADSTQTLGVKWAAASSAPSSFDDATNMSIASSVASNALTVALKDASGSDPSGGSTVKIGFRNSTATNGTYVQRSVTAALSVVLASGGTLGHVSAQNQYVWVYAIDNAGTVELALAGQRIWDEGTLQNTTAIGAGSTSPTVLYSTSARTGVAVRLIGRLKSNQTTAGTWAAAMTEISLNVPRVMAPYSSVILTNGNGYGSTNTAIRRYSTIQENVGTAFTVTQSATLGDSVTINENGLYETLVADFSAGGAINFGVSKNSNQLTTGLSSITASNIVSLGAASVSATSNITKTVRCTIGDVLRAHFTPGDPTGSTIIQGRFSVIKISE